MTEKAKEKSVSCTDTHACRWWEAHAWSKWADKAWSKLVRGRPLFVTTTSTADEPEEVGMECIQERRCARCGMLQLRSEQTRL